MISRIGSTVAMLACLGASQAHAELLNISTQALQSQNTAGVACTIVGTSGSTWRGLKALMVFSEASSAGSNPKLVATLLENNETMANDTWTGTFWVNGVAKPGLSPDVFGALLRRPMGADDAALLVSVPPGWRVCVSSTEVSGGDTLRRANVQITDVTDGFLAVSRSAADHPATVKDVPAGTINLMGTFSRLAGY